MTGADCLSHTNSEQRFIDGAWDSDKVKVVVDGYAAVSNWGISADRKRHSTIWRLRVI